jgi:serine/threonine-protein kinase
MTPERWALVERVYHSALACRAAEREAFLAQACQGDGELRCEVESLLAHDGDAALLSTPTVVGSGTSSLVGQRLGQYVISARLGAGGMDI